MVTLNGHWCPFLKNFYQLLAIFYFLLIVAQLCQADYSNENLEKYSENDVLSGSDFLPYNSNHKFGNVREPTKEERNFRQVYSNPLEVIYRMIKENQHSDPTMERLRKYDPGDRSFIRFGRRLNSDYLMKRPVGGDTSFLRFGKRSVNNN